MNIEQKQGVLILGSSILLVLVATLMADWATPFSDSVTGFSGIPINDCGTMERPYHYEEDASGELQNACSYKKYWLRFHLRLFSAWALLAPFLVYGTFRTLGIIRPLFQFERRLSKLIPGSDVPRDGA